MSTENNDSLIEADVIERAKTIARTSTDKDFADILGISSADFGQRKKRSTLLPLITRWAIKQNVDLNYLLRGSSTATSNSLDPDPEIASLLEGARRVLTSGNPIAFDALERNIRYFAHAIAAEKRADEMGRQIQEMKDDFNIIKAEMARLKRENLRIDMDAEEQSLKKKAR